MGTHRHGSEYPQQWHKVPTAAAMSMEEYTTADRTMSFRTVFAHVLCVYSKYRSNEKYASLLVDLE